MNCHPTLPRGGPARFAVVTSLLAGTVLAACGAGGVGPPVATATPVPTLPPGENPPWVATQVAFATVVERHRLAWQTVVVQTATAEALHPQPTATPHPPEPTPTMVMGMSICPLLGSHLEPRYRSCWQGIINGQLMYIGAGRLGQYDDPTQGMLLIFQDPDFVIRSPTTQIYKTPQKVGEVRIHQVAGTHVILKPLDPQYQTTFVFDLTTRQWVNHYPDL